MSHELKQYDIQEGREMAWHGLTKVNPELDLSNCWLRSWDYSPRRVLIETGDEKNSKPIASPFMSLGVTDVPALIVGKTYDPKTFKPILNANLLAKLETALKGQGLTLESCGTIMNRGRLFLSFALKDAKFQAANREFNAFLNIGNGNDMSCPFWMNTSNICTVCNNTFTANLNDRGMIMSVKKTQFSALVLKDLGAAVKAMLSGQKEFAKMLGGMVKLPCDEKTAREFFAGFIAPNPEEALSTRSQGIVDTLVTLFKTGAGNDGNDMSDVFQAMTDYYTHTAASADDDADARWKNFVSSEFGAGKQAKMDGWNFLNDEKLRKATITIGRKVLKLTAEAIKKAEAAENKK